ncbi:unnamed protein product [Callosobruchus maculatus]|uniref:Uncharacterized protein n=1 Tax=Callosobruchus maculatus TaxID=64391 RepID=A0A653BV24_CALMS|nr:unnamed protein product [Callosobruchus maculatus]
MDCLYQYWEKPTWNNCCPLCRLPINNLRLLENSKYKYMDSTRRILQKRIWKILSHSYILRLNHLIQVQTVRRIILCMIYLTIWTWTVANARNILHLFQKMYNLFYKQSPQPNSEIRT